MLIKSTHVLMKQLEEREHQTYGPTKQHHWVSVLHLDKLKKEKQYKCHLVLHTSMQGTANILYFLGNSFKP